MSTKYNADKKITYTNFKIFSFEEDGEEEAGFDNEPQPTVDEGEPDSGRDRRLPF